MYGSTGTSDAFATTSYRGLREEKLVAVDGSAVVAPSSYGGLSVPRARLAAVLTQRKARAEACARLPFALLAYAFLCVLVILHGEVSTSSDVVGALVDSVVNAYTGFVPSVVDPNSWIEYFAGEGASEQANSSKLVLANVETGWVNAVLSNRDNGVLIPCNRNRLNGCLRGRVNGALQIVGGVRFTQARSGNASCALPILRTLYGTCNSGRQSFATFGVSPLNLDADVAGAFNASSLNGVPSFQLWLDSTATRAQNQDVLLKLDAAGWLDSQTTAVTVELAVINGEVGFVGSVALTTRFRSGGRVVNSYAVSALPLEPYSLSPLMETMDVFAVVYFVYISAATIAFVIRTLRSGGGVRALLSWWAILSYVLVVSLFVAIIQYDALLRALSALPISSSGTIQDYRTGPSDLAPAIFAAAAANAAFKRTLVWVLLSASLLLFRYFAFQPRLAVMTDAFALIAVDMFHFAIVFAVIITALGVWGHFMFGPTAKDWRTTGSSFMAVMRMYQFDYDLPSMELADLQYADAFYIIMLNGVTNLALWMLVGIVLEAYSEVRRERMGSPSLFDEAALWLSQSTAFCSHPRAVCKWLMRTGGPRTGVLGSTDSVLPPYEVILAALAEGELAHEPAVTPGALAAALDVDVSLAARLIADVICARPADVESGWCAPLPASVEAALARVTEQQQARLLQESKSGEGFARAKSAVFERVATAAADAAAAAAAAAVAAAATDATSSSSNGAQDALAAQLAAIQAAVAGIAERLDAQQQQQQQQLLARPLGVRV